MNKRADRIQSELYKHFKSTQFLGDEQRCDLFLQWMTFFRRNLHRFVETYLQIALYPYQVIIMYLMGCSVTFVAIAARAVAKSFMAALYSCCMAILYPGCLIVLVSKTKGQARKMVSEKIEKELMRLSPNLSREIDKIQDNQNDTIVSFKNGSQIRVVIANEDARGNRANLVVIEEARLVSKKMLDAVVMPFLVTRQPPYLVKNPEYADVKELMEEPRRTYISSAWYKNHWLWKMVKETAREMAADRRSLLAVFDYAITLRHNIKTRKQLIKDKKDFDAVTWEMEEENVMMAEGSSAYFTYDEIVPRQTLTRAFYPRRFMDGRYRLGIPRQEGEVRIVSCDIAMINKKENDNSATTLIRMIPEGVFTDEEDTEHVDYHIQVPYIEANRGSDTLKQATRIKQLFHDFDADYCVLDVRSFGISVYDALAKVIYDDERGVEYKPWTCINDDTIADRVKNPSALPLLYAFTGSARRNSELAVVTKTMFTDKKIDLLVDKETALEEILPKMAEYVGTQDPEEQLFYERPYLETMALKNEMVKLQYEKTDIGIRLSEKSTEMKDRYISLAMGLYFASEYERSGIPESEGDLNENYGTVCVSAID